MTGLGTAPLALSAAHRERYAADGYLAFRELLDESEVEAARDALDAMLARSDGSQPWIAQVEPSAGEGRSVDETARPLRKLMDYCAHDAVLGAIAASHPRLRAIVDGLLGADATCFQDMALVKPPQRGSEKPWHQDAAYFELLPIDRCVGVWIALDTADVGNGCMRVVPGGHRAGPLRHWNGPVHAPGPGGELVTTDATDCQLVADRVDPSSARAIELPPGGVLVFSTLLPHQTEPNRSARTRRALQLHYRAVDTRFVDEAAYDAVFAEVDGSPASCRAASR